LPLPPLDTQREIVATLSAYDELMDNDRRRIELLEDAARLLYQEWFVHLRFPGHEQARTTDGIPEGWERVPFEDATCGYSVASICQNGSGRMVISNLLFYGIVGHHKEARAKGPGVFTGRSGSLGVVNYVESDYCLTTLRCGVREFKKVTPLFALFLLRDMRLEQYNGGASVPTLDRKAVHRVPVLIPTAKIRDAF